MSLGFRNPSETPYHLQLSLLPLFLKENLQGLPSGSKAARHALEVPRREGCGAPRALPVGRNPERAHGQPVLSEVQGRPWRESKGQRNLAVSCFEVHSRPRLDVKHGANLLWDDDLAFRADDGGFHRNLLHLGETIMPVPGVPGTGVPGTYPSESTSRRCWKPGAMPASSSAIPS